MDKIVSYNEFLKHKDDLTNYLNELFDKVPNVTVYFPNTLTRGERHSIYVNSKGYLFEKLHRVGSKYSIKLWKEKFENAVEELLKDPSDSEEEEDKLETLTEVIMETREEMLREVVLCRRGIHRLECIISFMGIFNFFGGVLLLLNSVDIEKSYSNMSGFCEII